MDSVLQKIYRSALKFLVPLTPQETSKLIVEEARKLVKADFGSIFLEEGGQLKRVYASIPELYKIKSRKKGFMYNTFKKRKPIIHSQKDIANIHPLYKRLKIQSFIGIPLSNHSKSIGVLSLISYKENHFTQREVDVLQLFAQIASLAIRKTQLFDETKKALEARDLFISMAAHELRTPLTTINGYIQLLQTKLAGANTSESKWMEELSWETYRLTLLVNELLEMERIKTGQLRYIWKECHLKIIAKRAINDFRFAHPDHQLMLDDQLSNSKDIVIGDFDKLLQVLLNVLDNAAKFSPPGSDIILSILGKPQYFNIIIQDQGQGISQKDMPQLFNKFYKGSDHTKEGMGLGLFLVKNILKQHKGTIEVQTKKNRGTQVQIKLPRRSYG